MAIVWHQSSLYNDTDVLMIGSQDDYLASSCEECSQTGKCCSEGAQNDLAPTKEK